MQPTFRHDCNECIYLGTVQRPGRYAHMESSQTDFDLYYHAKEGYTEVVARYGDDDPSYVADLLAPPGLGSQRDHPLKEARRRVGELLG